MKRFLQCLFKKKKIVIVTEPDTINGMHKIEIYWHLLGRKCWQFTYYEHLAPKHFNCRCKTKLSSGE